MVHQDDRALTNGDRLLAAALALRFALTPSEARVLMRLQPSGFATRREIHAAIGDTDPVTVTKIVDVIIGRLRRKMAPHDVEIANIRSVGFQLVGDAKERIRQELIAYGAEAAAAAIPAGKASRPEKVKQMIF